MDVKISPTVLAEFLAVCSRYHVSTFRLGDLAVQMSPAPAEFLPPEVTSAVVGGWKRTADLGE